jgi:hypothetical protein
VGDWRYNSTILHLGTRWRRVVTFTSLPLYSMEIAPGTHCIGDSVDLQRRNS